MAGAWACGTAVEAILLEGLVVVHAPLVLVDHLVLGSHSGDARDHLQLAHRRVLVNVQEDGGFLSLDYHKKRSCLFFPLLGQR